MSGVGTRTVSSLKQVDLLYWLPIAAIINCHKLNGLTQHKLLVL